MKVYIKSLDLDFSLEYIFNPVEQATVEMGCDPFCDLVLPRELFSGLPKKFLTIAIGEEEEVVIENLHSSIYLTINNEPLSKMRLRQGEYALQVMHYKFTIIIKY